MPAQLKLPKACTDCVTTYQTPDVRRGCPPAGRAYSKLISRDFFVATNSLVIMQGHLIRRAGGRRDLFLYIDGKLADRTLTYSSSTQWEDASVFYTGTLGKGSHSAWLASPNANTWGCQDEWGDLDLAVIPAVKGVAAYQTADTRTGCPPRAGANSALIRKDFTVAAKSVIIVQGHLIRLSNARKDLHLVIDGKLKDRTLTFTRNRQWEDASVFWSGEVNKGKHSVYLRSPQANVWGCQDQWGDLDIAVIPSSTGIKAYQVPDTRRGCPPKAGANKPLISKTFTVSVPSVVMITGHIIRNAPGRRDLHLILDGKLKDRTLTFTSSRQWEDASVFYSGPVGKGKHTAYLRGPNANTWGCEGQWGDLDIVVIPAQLGGSASACLKGDLDKNGKVNIEDLLALLGVYGSSKASGDVNKSGKVDIEDLLIVLGEYGNTKKC
jgi:hypothetical protein